MTSDYETLQTIAEALHGIKAELKLLNQTLARSTAVPKAEPATSSYGRTEYRSKRSPLGGSRESYARSGPSSRSASSSRSGPPKFEKSETGESRRPKSFKGTAGKPAKKPR